MAYRYFSTRPTGMQHLNYFFLMNFVICFVNLLQHTVYTGIYYIFFSICLVFLFFNVFFCRPIYLMLIIMVFFWRPRYLMLIIIDLWSSRYTNEMFWFGFSAYIYLFIIFFTHFVVFFSYVLAFLDVFFVLMLTLANRCNSRYKSCFHWILVRIMKETGKCRYLKLLSFSLCKGWEGYKFHSSFFIYYGVCLLHQQSTYWINLSSLVYFFRQAVEFNVYLNFISVTVV